MGPIQESNFAVHNRIFMKWFDGYLIKDFKGEKHRTNDWVSVFLSIKYCFFIYFSRKKVNNFSFSSFAVFGREQKDSI